MVKESGDARLVAFGFSSIGDCAYDPAADVLYVSDNADADDIPGALTGDTVFAIPSASTASGLTAAGLELLVPDSVPFAASVAVDATGDVFVSNAAGGGTGTVIAIDVDAGPGTSILASGFDYTAGLAIDPVTDEIFAAETRAGTWDVQVRRFDPLGVELPLFAGPSYGFGSFDLSFNADGELLATGLFFGDVVALDPAGTPSPFVSGLTSAGGVTVNSFTGRVEILSGFSGTDEDRTIHRFVPVSHLTPGRGSKTTECLHEYYGLPLAAPGSGRGSRNAICVDGAPCDGDGTANDVCLFPVGFCLNVPDPELPGCSPTSDIATTTVNTRPPDAAIMRAAAAMEDALPVSDASCFFSDGFAVPVRSTRKGKKPGVGRIMVEAVLDSGQKDRDAVKLVCEPAAS